MNVIFSQFGKEWNLYLKKQFIKYICALLLGGAAGFLLVKLVCMLDADSTYIYGASIFAMIFAGTWTFVIGNVLQTHFLLGVSMGQKRKNLIVSGLIFLVLLTVTVYIIVNVLLLLEKNVYPVLYAGVDVEGAWLVVSMQKWGLPVIGIVILTIWLFFVLNLKYGAKVFWIPYMVWMVVALISLNMSDTGIFSEILSRIILLISGFTAPVWIMVCVAADVLILLIGSRILMRLDVK